MRVVNQADRMVGRVVSHHMIAWLKATIDKREAKPGTILLRNPRSGSRVSLFLIGDKNFHGVGAELQSAIHRPQAGVQG